MCVDTSSKITEIGKILSTMNQNDRVLVFVETKRDADRICNELRREHFNCNSIHGDKDQRQRDFALENFKTGRCPILIATDVASRGIDVKDIKLVINYDLPSNIEDYVHRVGRTGRKTLEGFAEGKAISFYEHTRDSRILKDLLKLLDESKQPIPRELQDYARVLIDSRRQQRRYNVSY